MPVFVIAPLTLEEADATRIARVRRSHDPHVGIVPPHVTLVFALDDGLEDRAVARVRGAAAAFSATALRYTRAAVTRDYENSAWYLFLMPREIPPGLVELDRRLNTGLVPEAAEAGFDAHLSLGRFQERVLADAVARDVNDEGVNIPARIEALAVLRFDGTDVLSRVDVPLGGTA
ncbi:MAG: 2'-5' RNA ligase family protein [Dongia sp.]